MQEIVKKSLVEKNELLEAIIEEIKLSKALENDIRNEHAINALNETLLPLLPLLQPIKKLLHWNKDVNKKIKEYKKEILLYICFNKIQNNNKDLNMIKSLITDPVGNALFNKILQITNDYPPDTELLEHLSNLLYNITISNYNMLFSEHKYVISQIQTLTPQSLTILLDFENWPLFFVKDFSTKDDSDIIESNWLDEYSLEYIQKKGIDLNIQKFVKHCIGELITKRLIIAELTNRNPHCNYAKVELTKAGRSIQAYLKIKI